MGGSDGDRAAEGGARGATFEVEAGSARPRSPQAEQNNRRQPQQHGVAAEPEDLEAAMDGEGSPRGSGVAVVRLSRELAFAGSGSSGASQPPPASPNMFLSLAEEGDHSRRSSCRPAPTVQTPLELSTPRLGTDDRVSDWGGPQVSLRPPIRSCPPIRHC